MFAAQQGVSTVYQIAAFQLGLQQHAFLLPTCKHHAGSLAGRQAGKQGIQPLGTACAPVDYKWTWLSPNAIANHL